MPSRVYISHGLGHTRSPVSRSTSSVPGAPGRMTTGGSGAVRLEGSAGGARLAARAAGARSGRQTQSARRKRDSGDVHKIDFEESASEGGLYPLGTLDGAAGLQAAAPSFTLAFLMSSASPPSALRSAAVILLLGTPLGFLAGCGGPAASDAPGETRETTVRDLIADMDLAQVQREPGVVDVGTPEARTLLRKGWSPDEAEDGRTFVWSDGPESELEFFLAAPRDVPLTLRGTPYAAPDTPTQRVTVLLNGETVGRLAAPRGGLEARVTLPGRHLRAGENRLVLRYAWTRPPWKESRRRSAMAWDLLRFETGADEASRVRAAGDRLSLPFGTRLSSFQHLPAGAVLAIDDLRARGGEPGELRVLWRAEGGEEREVARLRQDGGPATIPLPDAGGDPVRLSLMAVADRPGAAAGSGLVLRRPALVAPRKEGASEADAEPSQPARPARGGRPANVILYLVDTLRADHLGCYGYGQPVSPRIDAFARDAATFRHTVAQSSWTRPSTTTILTGLLPAPTASTAIATPSRRRPSPSPSGCGRRGTAPRASSPTPTWPATSASTRGSTPSGSWLASGSPRPTSTPRPSTGWARPTLTPRTPRSSSTSTPWSRTRRTFPRSPSASASPRTWPTNASPG